MSTQQSSFPAVPFSITHPQQNFRLFELPPDLAELLSSHKKPDKLQLKSSSSNTTQQGNKSQNDFLHLCTNDKVWALRQVSTSNSVYITTSTQPPPPADTNAITLDDLPTSKGAITAISQPTSSLELIPVNVTPNTVEDGIRALIPVHPIPHDDNDEYLDLSPSPCDLVALTSNLPFPRNILNPTIRKLFIFDTPRPSDEQHHAYIPSDALLLKSWRCFYDTFMTMNGEDEDDDDDMEDDMEGKDSNKNTTADLTTFNVLSAAEITTAISQDEANGQVYAAVANAILEKFVIIEKDSDDDDENLDEEFLRQRYSLEGRLNGEQLTIWLGLLLVRCAGKEGIDEKVLLDKWLDLIPSGWAGFCNTSKLGGKGCEEKEGRWKYVDGKKSGGVEMDTEGGGGDKKAAAGVVAGKRNWHEKFARGR